VAAQAAVLAEVEASFAPLPVLRSPYRACEPVGRGELGAFADELYAGLPDPAADPCAVLAGAEPMMVRHTEDRYVLSLALPLADKREMDLRRKGEELVLTVAGHRRQLALPALLARRTILGAELVGDRLDIGFARDLS